MTAIKSFAIFSLLLVASLFGTDLPLKYQLQIVQPEKHLAKVQIEIPVNTDEDTLTLAMPAWSPGRYVIYNFAMNVFDVWATTDKGKIIRPKLIDKQTWKIPTQNSENLTVSYFVFANTLDGTFSQINEQGATLNGSSIFAYIKEKQHFPILLTIKAPSSWQIICALNPKSSGQFYAKCYDHLVDSPIEMGQLHRYSFTVQSKEHVLVFHQELSTELLTVLKQDLQKIIRYFSQIFDDKLPYEHYTFFYHLTEKLKHPDGMEHANSSRVLLRMDPNQIQPNANTDPDYDNLIWLSAHEFFHTWNVKRLRPKGLGPFDYSKEVYTPMLWIVEGWTSYFAYLSLLRTKIYTENKFLSELAGRISRYERSPGKTHRTLREVSILTWLFTGSIPFFAETNIHQTTYSYYYKGLIAAFLLDILLRSQVHPPSSLDELVHEMWTQFYKKQSSSYYLNGRGYTQAEFEQLILQKLGSSGKSFLETVVHSTKPLPYSLVERLGLKLVQENDRFYLRKDSLATPTAQQRWMRFKNP